MANLSLRHLYKVYSQGGVKAVSDFNMEIGDNEFIVFVGPSGCGKSTTLRMIAGLEDITAGEMLIDGKIVNHVQPKDRDIAMVFQNYALYPHMSTYDNMAFGLKIKKMPEEEIKKRVNEAAEILDIKDLLDRKPKNMSGGQRQRVALGRAIVRNPKVFLLDEPLSNLDAKLRTQMRIEIVKLHEKLATTFVYVTHDQVEAMTMGSRIVVMKDGFVQQIDTPQNLYKYPLNKFVAGFIGTPQMNFYSGTIEKKGESMIFNFANDQNIEYDAKLFEKIIPEYQIGKKDVILGIRPEDIFIDGSRDELYPKAMLSCKVSVIEKLGSEVLLYGDMDFDSKEIVSQSLSGITIKTDNKNDTEKDGIVSFVIDPEHIRLFDMETEKSILTRIPKINYDTNAIVKKDIITIFGHTFSLPTALKGRVAEGQYTAVVPTDAFIFGNKGAPVGDFSEEIISETRLIRIDTKSGCVFAIANESDKIKYFDLDMAKINLLDAEQKTVLASQTKQNFIKGSFIKNKKGLKDIITMQNQTYSFILEGEQIACPDTMAARLAYAFGRKAFNKQMGFVFNPLDVSFEEKEDCLVLEVDVTEILDFGKEKIAKMKYKGTVLHANIEKDVIGKVNIYIPWLKLSVYDLETKIKAI